MENTSETVLPRATAPAIERHLSSPASLGDRLLAQVVDGLVALGIFVLLGLTLAGKFGGLTDQGFELTGMPALILIGVLLSVMLVYFILLEAFFGTTLGKLVAEIKVATPDGGRISMRAAIIRNLMRLIDGIGLYLVGAFSVILTSNPTTTFSPDAPVIHFTFRVSQVQPGSRLKAVWNAVNVGAATPANSQLAESSVVLPGPAPGNFRFRRGPEPWPVGEYKVDLYLNDQFVLSRPYKITR